MPILNHFSLSNTMILLMCWTVNKLTPCHLISLSWGHEIELLQGEQLLAIRSYSINQFELKVLRAYVDKELQKGFMIVFRPLAAAPVLFIKNPNRDLRFA